MATPSNDDSDGYVNGRAAAEVQNDRVRDDVRSNDDGPGTGAIGRSPGLGGWIRRALRRVTGRSRATKVAVGATVGLLLLAACGSGANTSEVAGTQETQTEETTDEETDDADGGGSAEGTAVCDDPTDDGQIVDAEANETFEGDAHDADTVEFRIEGTEERLSVRASENPDKLKKQPAGPLRFDLWMISEDGTETGLVRVHSPAREEFNVSAGTDEDSLEPVDGGSPRIAIGGKFYLNIDRTLLPVLDGPFRWAFVETFEGNGTADICPNEASIDDPLADTDALASFPD